MTGDSRQEVEDGFEANLSRVRDLVATYDFIAGSGAGRASVGRSDVLRAAVILLHATLEDLLRQVERLRLPCGAATSFDRIRFVAPGAGSKDGKDRLTLSDLAVWRGRSVDDVLGAAIDAHLDHSNYNNVGEVRQSLDRAGVTHVMDRAEAAGLEAMMKRRHWIVHRADRNRLSGRGHHAAQSISKSQVTSWIGVVDAFARAVLRLV